MYILILRIHVHVHPHARSVCIDNLCNSIIILHWQLHSRVMETIFTYTPTLVLLPPLSLPPPPSLSLLSLFLPLSLLSSPPLSLFLSPSIPLSSLSFSLSPLLPSPPLSPSSPPSFSARLALTSGVKEIRAGALRVLRYVLTSKDIFSVMLKHRVDILVARSLDVSSAREIERIQAMRFVRQVGESVTIHVQCILLVYMWKNGKFIKTVLSINLCDFY